MPQHPADAAAAQSLRLPAGVVFAHCRHGTAGGDVTLPPALDRAVPRRQLDYIAGRRAAARAVQQLRGQPGVIGRDADGAPVWPRGLVGAISHSGGCAVALAGSGAAHAGLGVDLEQVIPCPSEIAPLVLDPAEARCLAALPLTPAQALTVVFSAKESLFKALYPTVRRRFGFDAARLLDIGPGHGVLRLSARLLPWRNGEYLGFRWTLWQGQVLTAIAVPPVPGIRDSAA